MLRRSLFNLGFSTSFMAITTWIVGTQFLTMPTSADPLPVIPNEPPEIYKTSAHGTTIKDLFDITSEALVELTNIDVNGSGDISVWTDPDSLETPDGSGTWTLSDELFVTSDVETFVTETDPVYFGTIGYSGSLVAGTMTAPGETPIAVVGLQVTTTVEYVNHEIEPVESTQIHVASRHGTIAEAEDKVDEMREAQDFDPDSPTPMCVDPSWIGNNGVECCAFYAMLQWSLKSCMYHHLAAITACLIGLGGGIAGCFATCVKTLVPSTFTVKGCLIGCSMLGLAAFVVCLIGAAALRAACIADAHAQYIRDLQENGCYPPPAEYRN